jgi:hypothetical protein
MNKQIPMISSGVAGSLGILHLPRLWQKASLGAVAKLHDDYPASGQGFDQMVLDGLAISREEFLAFVAGQKPSYPELEAWILEKKGGSLDAGQIQALNQSIVGYNHSADVRQEILEAAGIEDTEALSDAVNLNNLDDWASFHRAEIAD